MACRTNHRRGRSLRQGARKVAFSLALLPAALLAAPLPEAVWAFEPSFRPSLRVERAPGPIEIDGKLDDAGWQGVAVAEGFAENSPGDQVEPPVHSEAWVTYDDENFYIALIAHDDPATIRSSVSDRDNIWRDDYFGIMLDTYGDHAWGYEIFVNPLGVQGDLRMSSDGEEDIGFDLVWHSEGAITERGYQVEIAIPFASLRFLDKPEQVWRINFWRDHQREVRRRYSWAAIDRDDPCFLCQWGYLEGIRDIEPGRNLEVIGSLVGFQSGALDDFDDLDSFENEDPDGEIGASIRYGLSSSASAELTANPDFSQIESDAGQIDVNTTFALFFPERRPFFQEGSNLYSTWIEAIYTRSINDPTVAGKLSGQFGRTQVLYLFAQDENSPLLVPFEEYSAFVPLDHSISNIVRVHQSLDAASFIGGLVTDRRQEGNGSGTAFGIDSRVRIARSLSVEAQAMLSHTDEPESEEFGDGVETPNSPFEDYATFADGEHTAAFDGESFWGHALYTSLERDGRNYSADLDYWEFSPTFRTENGFTTRNDNRQTSFWNGVSFRPNRKVLQQWSSGLAVGRLWNTEGRFKDEWLEPDVNVSLIGQTQLGASYLWSAERFSGKTIEGIRRLNLEASTRFTARAGLSAWLSQGSFIRRDFSHPELGDGFELGGELNLQATDRLRIESSWNYSTLESRRHGGDFFRAHIARTRWNYNLSRRLYARLVLEYRDTRTFEYEERPDGIAVRTEARKRRGLAVEPLLTYQVNPFTVFYVGATSERLEFQPNGVNGLESAEWQEAGRQIFAKLSYLWQM